MTATTTTEHTNRTQETLATQQDHPPNPTTNNATSLNATSITSDGATTAVAADPTVLPILEFNFHWLRPTIYLVFLLFCNVLIPCLLYYLLLIYTKLDEKEVVGISSAALGLSSCFDAPFRLWKLVRRHKIYGPLNDPKWYHFDFTMVVYTWALFIFALPLAIAPAVPLYQFFLLSMPLLVLPVTLVFFLSLKSWKLPVWASSDKPGTPTKPAAFYILEDVVAVDFGRGRKWRKALNDRYAMSKPFQDLMYLQTLYWTVTSTVYFGASCGVVWGASFYFAFGFVLGLFFIWAFLVGYGSYLLSKWGLKREKRIWNARPMNEEFKTEKITTEQHQQQI